MAKLKRFKIRVPGPVITDLKRRLAKTRWPDELHGAGWDYGANLAYIKELCDYWRTTFDWKKQQALLNSLPQFKEEVDGLGIHFVHLRGKGPKPLPLILTHGWPGSFFEFYKAIPLLTDPAAHGGDPSDAFTVVVPSLPGYGFSNRPAERGMHLARVGELFAKLMRERLGYTRYGAQGGDWGAGVTTRLGLSDPQHVVGIHLNMVLGRAAAAFTGTPSPEEEAWRKDYEKWRAEEAAYSQIQGTKPQTLAYGLNDSPAGLAAWIVEKFRRWSDCNGDVESIYTKDELLTNITIYWVTETINSSVRFYYENTHGGPIVPPGQRVEVPTGVAVFPKEIIKPPRSIAERGYNITRWTEMPRGGHFAAIEQPELLVQDVRGFFRPLRG
ncbi:MAG: epoxide hydrolase [Chloroflexi bacterium]|nr:epoxide hydrolase [Chloroflexota bacterium]